MPVLPDPLPEPPELAIDAATDAGRFAPHWPAETAIDGSPARRPGDPDPAPQSDGAPLFSTDPLDR